MPKIRTTRTKKPPEGFEEIESILDDYAKKMRDAENESHEGKRKSESLWPIMRISHTRSRYIYELYYKREAISKELYEWLLKEGYADANLIAKWKKTGYEKLCCVRCIQTRDMNYQGSTCICRVPKAQVKEGTVVQCVHCVLDRPRNDEAGSSGFTQIELAGGILSGENPSHFDTANPIRIWVIQLILIVCMTQGLALVLAKLKQPRVIAEVIGGILLGPTAFGRIPNFSKTVFPPESLPYLSLVATIGLCLFMFVIAMELDIAVIKRNAKASTAISAAGMILPFGVGVAVAVPIYHQFIDPEKASFGHFLLFVGVAISITAFPVLCRILTELKLLDTHVGVTTLSAGVGNDVVGWILLALTVALVNASEGLTALYILLTCVGWILFVLFPVKWGYRWLARYSGSLGSGTPTPFMMTVTMLLVFASAFFTDVIGVHAIFGAFIAGLVIPRDNGFSIALLEKIEDLVSILFLPLYFTLSGLKTDLGLLNDGTAWGYTFLVIVVAFLGKFIGCAVTARLMGFNTRESGAIGMLMSCKGLVELIVLNIGLAAGILDTKVFSMFVMMAVVLTFITSPCTVFIYPERVRQHISANKSSSEDPANMNHRRSVAGNATGPISLMTRFTVVLSKIEHLPAVMTLTQFLQPPLKASLAKPALIGTSDEKMDLMDPSSPIISPLPSNTPLVSDGTPRVTIDALRLIELTERTSAVMRVTAAEELMHRDTLISVMRTFGHLNRIPVSSALSIVPQESFSSSVTSHARETNADLVVVPWNAAPSAIEEIPQNSNGVAPQNPFDAIFGGRSAAVDKATALGYSQFIRRVFVESPADVALFIDRGLSPLETSATYGQHIFLPFFGGPDDRLALAFVVQLCAHPAVSATVMRMKKTDGLEETETRATDVKTQQVAATLAANNMTVHSVGATSQFDTDLLTLVLQMGPDTIYPQNTTQTRLQSETADNLFWTQMVSSSDAQSPAIQGALSRITFVEDESPTPLAGILKQCSNEHDSAVASSKALLVVVGRGRRLAAESHTDELREIIAASNASGTIGGEVRRTVGDVATAFVATGAKASLFVLQASDNVGDD
ncbi:potassium/sodium hyperpolarization-activated cyclic nucleotide-gated channel 4 [Rhizoctonia solani]|uniref:Potassium/sodium hyperpolarization-activated cyclic nucleotide-gated channel 4 n=1 Tax=Rhizoctonia solani TaxID=456999 RepID=A0A8H8NPI7_9AGAM|nr:potassium/sodium hyperpolarization-activated cyclic nucleotide-gated channel 4 [Rhizoctonia solani]QRW16338.1 potassium/sodium hyperpolarization-activated cyclic nucleotide-gated channel 4 [Rhizoctonia solani]